MSAETLAFSTYIISVMDGARFFFPTPFKRGGSLRVSLAFDLWHGLATRLEEVTSFEELEEVFESCRIRDRRRKAPFLRNLWDGYVGARDGTRFV